MKALVRLVGFLLLAAGFVVVVADGAVSIGAEALRFTSVGEALERFAPSPYAAAQTLMIEKLPPVLWDPVAVQALRAPAAAALIVVGLLLMILARRRDPQIGAPTRL